MWRAKLLSPQVLRAVQTQQLQSGRLGYTKDHFMYINRQYRNKYSRTASREVNYKSSVLVIPCNKFLP